MITSLNKEEHESTIQNMNHIFESVAEIVKIKEEKDLEPNASEQDVANDSVHKETEQGESFIDETTMKEDTEEKKTEKPSIKYEDGSPKISFFTNSQNLKIAKYAWEVENPKGYVFALHGITSHLRNEYMGLAGKPYWVDELINENKLKKDEEEKEKEKGENNKEEKKAKTECNELSNDQEKTKGTLHTENSNEERENEMNTEIESEALIKNPNDFTNEEDPCYAQTNILKKKRRKGLGCLGRAHSIVQMEHIVNEVPKNMKINLKNDLAIFENDTGRSMVIRCNSEDSFNQVIENAKIEESEDDENSEEPGLDTELTRFLSCSSFNTSHSYNEPNYDPLKFSFLHERLNKEVNEHKLVYDDNVLAIDENNAGGLNVKCEPNMYFCTNCNELTTGCECGGRTLSYRNSWIEILNQQQFSFYGIDNQSHGLSEGWQNQRCNVQNFEHFILDAVQALDLLVEEWKEKGEMKPIIIMGVSMGGCIALRTLDAIFKLNKPWKKYVSCLVLISPMLSLEKQKSKIINRILLSVTKFINYFYPHLGLQVKERNAFYSYMYKDSELDPLQYFGPLKLKIAVECVNAADGCLSEELMKRVDESGTDVLILQSKFDSIVDPKGAVDFINKMIQLHEQHTDKQTNEIEEDLKKEDNGSTTEEEEELETDEIYNKENKENTNIGNNNNNQKDSSTNDNNNNDNNNNNNNDDGNEIKQCSNFEETLLFSEEEHTRQLLSLDKFARTKSKIWNIFNMGFFKSFIVKKKQAEDNKTRLDDVDADDDNIDIEEEGKNEFKRITTYILNYGCHTLATEPQTKDTAKLLIQWLNEKFE